MGEEINSKKKTNLRAVQVLAIGFILLILIGGVILSLPISSVDGKPTNLLDSIFTATSAVCVTGLVVVDTGTHWNLFGQIIILLLIQIGALGFMSFTTMLAIIMGKKITLRNRLIVQEAMNAFDIQGLVKMVKHVVGFTFFVEICGAIVLSTQFIPQYGIIKGIYYGIFHSVTAFCNAGFDIIGNYTSFTAYGHNTIILLTLAGLLIIGGLGFAVWLDIYHVKKAKRLSVHSKVVITTTISLLVVSTFIFLALEYSNDQTLGIFNFKDKIVNAFFASASPRTAGFNSISIDGMTDGSKLFSVALMFIGGSPGSTAGGVKTSTITIMILTVISVIKGREDTEVFGRRIEKDLVYKALVLFFMAFLMVLTVTMILTITEPKENFINLLYEAASALGTAGLTTGVTQRLTTVGKVLIMINMYLGRVGLLTVATALTSNRKGKKGEKYKYPSGKILIG